MHTILVLGGYGFFGTRICQALTRVPDIRLLIAGRSGASARACATRLQLPSEHGVALDANVPDLAQHLTSLQVDTLIHTAGPFQGQNYAVAQAAIHAGAHYIDLADGRDFVAGIQQLDEQARAKGVLVTSGASSLPALSAAVVDRYLSRFSRLDSIRHGIASGARAPGIATMRGVFSYGGKAFQRLEAGKFKTTYGWMDLNWHQFPAPIGHRFLGSCDVPDLDLFPRRYKGVRTVTFHAGFAFAPGHLFVWTMAALTRLGVLRTLLPLVAPLHAISQWTEPVVSDKGAMFVTMEGLGVDSQPLHLTWHLIARSNHGPYIPCGAAIALAKKLAHGAPLPTGAMPCMGLISVEEYLAALDGFDVHELLP